MSDNSIIERLRKLLNMTVENGCSEDEQETALRMAAAIAAKSGIDLAAAAPKNAAKRVAAAKSHYTEFKVHQAFCAEAAAILYGIECSVYNLGASGLMFVGRDELIEAAEHTMFWLFRQVESLYKEALPKGLSKTARAEFRKTFKAACAHRVRERASALMRDLQRSDASAQAATGHNALVVRGHFDQVRSEVEAYWQAIYDRANKQRDEWKARDPKGYERAMKEALKRRGPRGRSIPVGSGTGAGRVAAERVQLREQVR